MEPQNSLSRTEALEVVIRGLYYFPAYKHHSQTPTNIWCDYCKRTGLNCSIGYQNYDLCLGCVEMLTNTNRTLFKISIGKYDLNNIKRLVTLAVSKDSSYISMETITLTYIL